MVKVTFTWSRLNPKEPIAWDAAAAHYKEQVGKDFESLGRSEQIQYVRAYVNR